MVTEVLNEFNDLGRIWLRGALDKAALTGLRHHVHLEGDPGKRYSKEDSLVPAIRRCGLTARLDTLFPGAQPRRVVAFDKGPKSNWQLPWHQDRVIALRERQNVAGFTNWSRKAGVWHCEAPSEVLRKMLFVRVHLDRSSVKTGAMEIALGSHKSGKLTKAEIADLADQWPAEVTEAEPGDVLVMSMFMVHRSLPASEPSRRRVIRLDYGVSDLPAPLAWAM